MRKNNTSSRIRSQKARILAYLQAGGSLTPMEAISLCGSTKLATRISELINKEGHTEIQKRWVWVQTPDASDHMQMELTRVMQYSIPAELRGYKPENQARVTEKI